MRNATTFKIDEYEKRLQIQETIQKELN